MSDTNSDAKLGRMYRRLRKARRQLEKSRNEASQMAKHLRVLADCFDKDKEPRITAIRDGRFDSTHPDAQYERIGKDWPEFPDDAARLAQDILDLTEEIAELESSLDLEVDCL